MLMKLYAVVEYGSRSNLPDFGGDLIQDQDPGFLNTDPKFFRRHFWMGGARAQGTVIRSVLLARWQDEWCPSLPPILRQVHNVNTYKRIRVNCFTTTTVTTVSNVTHKMGIGKMQTCGLQTFKPAYK